MARRFWLNHAGHLCQGCRECSCGASPRCLLGRSSSMATSAPRSRHVSRRRAPRLSVSMSRALSRAHVASSRSRSGSLSSLSACSRKRSGAGSVRFAASPPAAKHGSRSRGQSDRQAESAGGGGRVPPPAVTSVVYGRRLKSAPTSGGQLTMKPVSCTAAMIFDGSLPMSNSSGNGESPLIRLR